MGKDLGVGAVEPVDEDERGLNGLRFEAMACRSCVAAGMENAG